MAWQDGDELPHGEHENRSYGRRGEVRRHACKWHPVDQFLEHELSIAQRIIALGGRVQEQPGDGPVDARELRMASNSEPR